MISWNQIFCPQIQPLQSAFYHLFAQVTSLQSQIEEIQSQNQLIKKNISEIDQKNTQIQQLLTQKLKNTQEPQHHSKQTIKRKKTCNSEDHDADILLVQKQQIKPQKMSRSLLKPEKQQKTFCCPYKRCQRMYKSSFSLNLHIKIFHNGGSKRQREKYASLILQAEQNGDEVPQVPIKFPQGFLQEFRSSFKYMKKYKM